jgi:hypothetical protein
MIGLSDLFKAKWLTQDIFRSRGRRVKKQLRRTKDIGPASTAGRSTRIVSIDVTFQALFTARIFLVLEVTRQ